MELKENMLIRTEKGKILKYNPHDILYNEFEDNYYYIYDDYESDSMVELVVEASYDIIDLIEVGDYVNGMKVTRICFDEDGNRILNLSNCILELMNEDIKSIVTHEQFESISYKVGE